MYRISLLLFLNVLCLSVFSQAEITEKELREHVVFLASEKNAGRYPGGKANRRVVRYLKNEFKKIGLQPFELGYKQKFEALLRVEQNEREAPKAKTCNVVGFIEGADPILKNEYLVLGAHYDHLGLGGPSSKSDKKNAIHYGADDNASGTAALLEIAEKMAFNKQQLKRSVIFIAFGAEEQGLLGSKYFVENPLVPLTQIKLMVNMDMVGRLNAKKHVYMGGAGTFPGGMDLMKTLAVPLGINPIVHAGSVGGSDHVSFYKKQISVLGLHTGGHPQYHTPEDTVELLNIEGEKLVCEYIFNTLMEIASTDYKIQFIKQD